MFKLRRIVVTIAAIALLLNLAAAAALAKQTPVEKVNLGPGQGKGHLKVLFRDTNGHWADEYIRAMNMQGIIKGYGDGTFKPENGVTKAEAITMIIRMLNPDVNTDDVLIPEPVKSNGKIEPWAKPYIALALQKGILTSEDLQDFSSNEEAWRYQVAVWIARALGLEVQAADSEDPFKDSSNIPGWAKRYIKAISNKGIITGYSDQNFYPNKGILRAEMAAMLFRVADWVSPGMLKLIPAKGVINDVDTEQDTITMTVYGNPHITYLDPFIPYNGNKSVTFKVYESAPVYVNGNVKELSDEIEGCRATVLLNQDKEAVLIVVKTTPPVTPVMNEEEENQVQEQVRNRERDQERVRQKTNLNLGIGR